MGCGAGEIDTASWDLAYAELGVDLSCQESRTQEENPPIPKKPRAAALGNNSTARKSAQLLGYWRLSLSAALCSARAWHLHSCGLNPSTLQQDCRVCQFSLNLNPPTGSI